MTSTQIELIIALVGLIFGIMVAILGFVIRAASKWATAEANLAGLRSSLESMVRLQAESQAAMYATMRDDRVATNERLLFLERRDTHP